MEFQCQFPDLLAMHLWFFTCGKNACVWEKSSLKAAFCFLIQTCSDFRFHCLTFDLKQQNFSLSNITNDALKVLKLIEMGVQASARYQHIIASISLRIAKKQKNDRLLHCRPRHPDPLSLWLLCYCFLTLIFILFQCKWAVMAVVMSCYLFSALYEFITRASPPKYCQPYIL